MNICTAIHYILDELGHDCHYDYRPFPIDRLLSNTVDDNDYVACPSDGKTRGFCLRYMFRILPFKSTLSVSLHKTFFLSRFKASFVVLPESRESRQNGRSR